MALILGLSGPTVTAAIIISVLIVQGSGVNGQQNGPPKILPIATADSYPEGSSINLICTVSGGQRRGLTLSWTLNGDDISEANKHSDLFDNVAINTDDADISILKIKNATLKNSGQYTCTARNPLGQDSTSVKIVINVDMKWSKVPKDKVEVGIGKEVMLECNAIGSPQPIIEWIKHSSEPSGHSDATQTLSKGGVLKISRAQHRDSGLYECLARNGVNDNLRKFVELKVRVNAAIMEAPRQKNGRLQLSSIVSIISVLVAILAVIQLSLAQQNGEHIVSLIAKYPLKGRHHDSSERNINNDDGDLTKLMTDTDGRAKVLQYLDANGQPVLVQFTYVGAPKILPIATADSYPEGATINLICTVSGGQRKGLTLEWSKDGQGLNDESMRYSRDYNNISIEKTGVDISILRITNATSTNSGRYSCKATNPIGEDSTSVNISINVELKWNKLPADTEIGLNQDVSVECDATSQPQPQVQWFKLSSSTARGFNETGKPIVVSHGKMLKITKAQHKDSGLYECVARNGVDQDLRRVIQVKVRGK